MTHHRPLRSMFALFAVTLLVALAGEGFQSAARAAEPAPAVSADAQKVLDQIKDTYGKLTSLELSGTFSGQFDVAGRQEQLDNPLKGAFHAPGQFRHEMENDVITGSDGTTIYIYVPEEKMYQTTAAPESEKPVRLSDLPAQLASVVEEQNPSLAMALSSDPLQPLLARATDVSVAAEPHDLNGSPATVLTIKSDDVDRQVFVDPQTHLLRRVESDITRRLESAGAPDVKRAELRVDYAEVKSGGAFGAEHFAWAPPEGARPAPAQPAAEDDGGLVGQAAPDFTLPSLEGGQDVTLSDLKGSVVVLDFWATWCGPCVASMPKLQELHEEKSPDGLKVFAINLQEEKEKVSEFLKSKNLSLPVLLDQQGEVGQTYSVQSIPFTLVIGKDGIVRDVLIGFGPESEQKLRASVDEAMNE